MRADELFARLGTAIRDEWSAASFDERRLPEIAARWLRAIPPAESVTPDDIVDVALARGAGAGGAQRSFGQPTITVFADRRFFIEALFWLDGTTAIHEHGFSGAFTVLAGGSVHAAYAFDETARLNAGFRLGRLRQTSIELLHRGDIRPIHSGPRLIHSLFHLDRPSVSIVVRTPRDADAGAQLAYLYPGIAYDPFARGTGEQLAAQTLEMLRLAGNPRYRALLVAHLQRCEVREALELLLGEAAHHDVAWLDGVLDALGETPYAAALPMIGACVRDAMRTRRLMLLRAPLTARGPRLTLGLLLNCRDRQSLLRLLGSEAALVTALGELAAAGIGFPDDDDAIELVPLVLAGLSHDEVLARLATAYEPAEVAAQSDAIRASCEVLRAHPLLAGIVG